MRFIIIVLICQFWQNSYVLKASKKLLKNNIMKYKHQINLPLPYDTVIMKNDVKKTLTS